MNESNFKPDRSRLKARLTAEQYRITQEAGTEPAFTGQYVDCKDDGTYSCVVCGNKIFGSDKKYDSGSGWPSFWLPLAEDRVREQLDDSHGMRREGVMCADCDAHLGHVSSDGPKPSGLRYCINSAALEFEHREHTESTDDSAAKEGRGHENE